MRIEILDEAEQDIIAGFSFYERQAPGLWQYFLDSIFADIESLHIYAGIHPLHFGFHRFLAKRFPFAIYYLAGKDLVQVYAILDCRQNPSAIHNRLT
jgi:plasmid stabilization system protein ParE